MKYCCSDWTILLAFNEYGLYVDVISATTRIYYKALQMSDTSAPMESKHVERAGIDSIGRLLGTWLLTTLNPIWDL